MPKIVTFNTGDKVQDWNLAEHYVKEHDSGRIVPFADCVVVVDGEE